MQKTEQQRFDDVKAQLDRVFAAFDDQYPHEPIHLVLNQLKASTQPLHYGRFLPKLLLQVFFHFCLIDYPDIKAALGSVILRARQPSICDRLQPFDAYHQYCDDKNNPQQMLAEALKLAIPEMADLPWLQEKSSQDNVPLHYCVLAIQDISDYLTPYVSSATLQQIKRRVGSFFTLNKQAEQQTLAEKIQFADEFVQLLLCEMMDMYRHISNKIELGEKKINLSLLFPPVSEETFTRYHAKLQNKHPKLESICANIFLARARAVAPEVRARQGLTSEDIRKSLSNHAPASAQANERRKLCRSLEAEFATADEDLVKEQRRSNDESTTSDEEASTIYLI